VSEVYEALVIDRSRCMAPSNPSTLGGPRCQAPAAYSTVLGRRCTRCAEELRRAMRDPNTFINVIVGRARTEEEIDRMVVALPS
jgi:hypothetical protein